mgnify:CR=1 FL=1
MKEFLYGWIRDIAFYAILMTVILHLLPEEGQKKYVRFFMGVVLMLVVLSPLLSVAGLSGTLDSIYAEQTYDEELQDFTRRKAEAGDDRGRHRKSGGRRGGARWKLRHQSGNRTG